MDKKTKEFNDNYVADYGDSNIGLNTNPLFTNIFQQPADVDKAEFEYKKVLLSDLHPFPNHPFKVKVDDEMMDLRDSIIDNGVLQPLIVRPNQTGSGYTILSGHRRCKACELAKITNNIPVIIVKNINDAQATIMMVDSNKQREVILPSEKAYAYKMRLDAMKSQGKRNDLTLDPMGPKSKRDELTSSPMGTKLSSGRSDSELAEQVGESRNTIQRYIRLTHLIPQLLDYVDNSVLKLKPCIAFRPAVEISYLSQDEQKYFYDTIKALEKTPSVEQAMQIKKLSQNGKLTQTEVMNILVVDKPNQKEVVKFDYDKINTYYNDSLTPNECQEKVFETLNNYQDVKSILENAFHTEYPDDEEFKNELKLLVKGYLMLKSNAQKNIMKEVEISAEKLQQEQKPKKTNHLWMGR